MNDPVNSPDHYTQGGMEVIDILQAKLPPPQYIGHLLGNTLKYLFRFQIKGRPLEDLKKARFYLNRLIDYFGRNE